MLDVRCLTLPFPLSSNVNLCAIIVCRSVLFLLDDHLFYGAPLTVESRVRQLPLLILVGEYVLEKSFPGF